MSALMEVAETMLSAAQRRLELVAHNVTNTNTYGFKSSTEFSEFIGLESPESGVSARTVNFTPGALSATENPLDLALSSEGYFALQGVEGQYLTRAGQFQIDTDGQVVDGNGLALLNASGAPLFLTSDDVEILENGTVLERGLPVARVGVFEPASDTELALIGGTLLAVPEDGIKGVDRPLVRQGMLESSNVELTAEMIDMMASLRQAEMGARIVQMYDTLMEQAVATFGRSGR